MIFPTLRRPKMTDQELKDLTGSLSPETVKELLFFSVSS